MATKKVAAPVSKEQQEELLRQIDKKYGKLKEPPIAPPRKPKK